MKTTKQIVHRNHWKSRVEAAWEERSVLWLSGVRRVGKTCLCQSLPDVEYFDCELPRTRRPMEDPESFLAGLRGKRVVVDEIHRLSNATELLKIAADYFPEIPVLAAGSSTLGASAKFKDTLTGRKRSMRLTPMISCDLSDFGRTDLPFRLLRGGLPPFFLSPDLPEVDFQEWMDAYWSKDIAELFRLERRSSFQRFLELVLVASGGIFQVTRFSRSCEVSRNTIMNYLWVLEATHVAHVLRPFSKRGPSEIVSAPKVYGFDTGFVCYHKGWDALRNEDLGLLWEHYVLNELQGKLQMRNLNYWRDKRGHEVDLVVVRRGRSPTAVECKWSARDFAPRNLASFRGRHPEGSNFVVSHDVDRAFERKYRGLTVRFVGLDDLVAEL